MTSSPLLTASHPHPGTAPAEPRIEVWGGVEPTVNRVGDHYLDQLTRSGHATRIDDLDRFAELGIRAIRYPVLWEKIAPGHIGDADWSWPDTRLARLRELGVRPIVGLIHHGSGPRHTSLIDPAFPEHLADYAGAVARRYPWVEDYTPVNEPLTTARFSALYGHWYPHERSDCSFARALVGQCRSIALAMRAIREVNSAARLIQTEELGQVHSTPVLAYQAEYENERRWLTYDLLSGQLTPDRRLWTWLLESGISQHELEWFLDNPCPPDVLGVNYYLTSERFLDERIQTYPNEPTGSNGFDTYVDICAARVLPQEIAGIGSLLKEAGHRYQIPLAVTEVHNGSTREEQLRWLHEVWDHANIARSDGIDVRAITVWALLGSYDWPSLLTLDRGLYEPGAFDLRSAHPRPTALAHMTRNLATYGRHDHPVLETPGWWRRPDRFAPYANLAAEWCPGQNSSGTSTCEVTRRKILILGDNSGLASDILGACEGRHIPAEIMHAADFSVIETRIGQGDIWAVILAGRDLLLSLATWPPNDQMATLCASRDIQIVAFSINANVETSEQGASPRLKPAPTDEQLLAICPNALIVDPKLPHGVDASGLANMVIDLLIDGEQGIWRLHQPGEAPCDGLHWSPAETHLHSDAADD